MECSISTTMTEQWVQEQQYIYLRLPETAQHGASSPHAVMWEPHSWTVVTGTATSATTPTTAIDQPKTFADVVDVADLHYGVYRIVGCSDEPTTKTIPTSRQHHLLLNSYHHDVDCCYVSSETTTTTTNATLPESEDSFGLTQEERFFGGWPSEDDVDNQDSE